MLFFFLSFGEMPFFDTGTSNFMCHTLVPWFFCLTWYKCFTCATFLYAENLNLKMLLNMKNCITITTDKILKPDKFGRKFQQAHTEVFYFSKSINYIVIYTIGMKLSIYIYTFNNFNRQNCQKLSLGISINFMLSTNCSLIRYKQYGANLIKKF